MIYYIEKARIQINHYISNLKTSLNFFRNIVKVNKYLQIMYVHDYTFYMQIYVSFNLDLNTSKCLSTIDLSRNSSNIDETIDQSSINFR